MSEQEPQTKQQPLEGIPSGVELPDSVSQDMVDRGAVSVYTEQAEPNDHLGSPTGGEIVNIPSKTEREAAALAENRGFTQRVIGKVSNLVHRK